MGGDFYSNNTFGIFEYSRVFMTLYIVSAIVVFVFSGLLSMAGLVLQRKVENGKYQNPVYRLSQMAL
jgi:hypothetical protein